MHAQVSIGRFARRSFSISSCGSEFRKFEFRVAVGTEWIRVAKWPEWIGFSERIRLWFSERLGLAERSEWIGLGFSEWIRFGIVRPVRKERQRFVGFGFSEWIRFRIPEWIGLFRVRKHDSVEPAALGA
jgi:hypothetical protein